MKPEFGIRREQENQLYYSAGRNPRSKLHFHSQIELYLIHQGQVEVWINEKRAILKEGEISVAFSYDAHSYRAVTESQVSYLIVPTHLCGDFLASVNNKKAGSPFIRDPAAFQTIHNCCLALRESENKVKTQGYIYIILGTVLEQLSLEERSGPVDPQLSARLLFYLQENFRSELSLSTVAAAFGLNPSYLSRYFKDCFHIGLNQYITLLRLREAVLLMREGKGNIACCAFESGFSSVRTFYRAFDQEFHCTPKEYLQQMK